MSDPAYRGRELDVFEKAIRWKAYFGARLEPYLGRDVLEVGAGLGATTRALCDGSQRRWTCLEPDPGLAERLGRALAERTLPACCELRQGTSASIREPASYDSVLYIDVLEHIKEDTAEVERSASLLRPGGHVIVLAPAHPWLFTPFDAAIGHERRYTRTTLRAAIPRELTTTELIYMDAVGLLASLGNRLLLRRADPTESQILFWDRVLVPLSRWVDPLTARRLGKSVLGIFRLSS